MRFKAGRARLLSRCIGSGPILEHFLGQGGVTVSNRQAADGILDSLLGTLKFLSRSGSLKCALSIADSSGQSSKAILSLTKGILSLTSLNGFCQGILCKSQWIIVFSQQQIPHGASVTVVPRQADAVEILLFIFCQVNLGNTIFIGLDFKEDILSGVFLSIVASILLGGNLVIHIEHELQAGSGHDGQLTIIREICNDILGLLANDEFTLTTLLLKYRGKIRESLCEVDKFASGFTWILFLFVSNDLGLLIIRTIS